MSAIIVLFCPILVCFFSLYIFLFFLIRYLAFLSSGNTTVMTVRFSLFLLVMAAGAWLSNGKRGKRPQLIVHIMADDLGRDNLGLFNGNKTFTPNLNDFFANGIFMSSFHTFKICGPSRASTMTGRYPFNAGFYGDGNAQHISNFTSLGGLMKREGFETHAIGKWDVGHVVKETTPTFKGFDSFLGYYMACNHDLYYHSTGYCDGDDRGTVPTDFSENVGDKVGPAKGRNGTYSTRIFSARAVKLIQTHDFQAKPLYLYVAPQNVHLACGKKEVKKVQGIQAPCETVELYDQTARNDTYKGQSAVTTELDFLVGNITETIRSLGQDLWDNTLLVFASDNGGPLDHTTNYPLRGGKHTFWDGGVKTVAGVSGGFLPRSRKGEVFRGLVHSADWYRTLVEGAVGGAAFGRNSTGPVEDDSVNVWDALLSGSSSPRTQVIHQVQNQHFSEGVTAIQQGAMKLILGPPGDRRVLKWPDILPHGHTPVPFGRTGGVVRWDEGERSCLSGTVAALKDNGEKCTPGCLFNVTDDPSESNNLYHMYPDLVERMKGALQRAGAKAPPPSNYWAHARKGLERICTAQKQTGFLEPVEVR